jgi:hypothetical protein
MTKNLFLFAWCMAVLPLAAQVIPEREADFISRKDGPLTLFGPIVPPLIQIAGAPVAYYDYYWEFGDGAFSFEQYPQYVYADTLEKVVYFMATGKYDNGKAPKSRKKAASPSSEKPKSRVAYASPAVLPEAHASVGMRAVRNPRAGEDLVCIMAYANHTPVAQSGKLHVFFNQKDYKNDHFRFLEARTHFGEQEEAPALSLGRSPALSGGLAGRAMPALSSGLNPETALTGLQKEYKNEVVWNFSDLQAGELRHLFVSLQATELMLADTHAIITATALLVPDGLAEAEQYVLEMEIVPSHDPNFIAVSPHRLSFRHIRRKDLTYKVHFQNNGEGPASTVEITCDVPRGLDPSSLKVLGAYPLQLPCTGGAEGESCLDTGYVDGRLVFTFRNIYLPGTRQEGVREPDSTRGFVKYSLAPGKDIRKRKLNSGASIVFDKNPPIRTKGVGASFKPGFSPGLAAGWNAFPGDAEQGHLAFGLTLAPFSPFKSFLQWECWMGFTPKPSYTESVFRDTLHWMQDLPGMGFLAVIDSFTTNTKRVEERSLFFSLTPLQLRKNLGDWIGIGMGLLLDMHIKTTSTGNEVKAQRFVYAPDGSPIPDLYKEDISENRDTDRKTAFHPALFADLHLGRVRHGPSVGLRGVLRIEKEPGWYALLFAAWKF